MRSPPREAGRLINQTVTLRTITPVRHSRTGTTAFLLHLSTTTELLVINLISQHHLGPSRFMRPYRPPIRFEHRYHGCHGSRYRGGDVARNAHAETIPAGKLSAHRTFSDSREVRSNGCLEGRRLSSASGITSPSQDHRSGELTLLIHPTEKIRRLPLTRIPMSSSYRTRAACFADRRYLPIGGAIRSQQRSRSCTHYRSRRRIRWRHCW